MITMMYMDDGNCFLYFFLHDLRPETKNRDNDKLFTPQPRYRVVLLLVSYGLKQAERSDFSIEPGIRYTYDQFKEDSEGCLAEVEADPELVD